MTPIREERGKSERLQFRFPTGAPTRNPDTEALDSRAIYRTLIGLRDRLRLQEDELDRLREIVWSAIPETQPAAPPADVKRPIPMPTPAIDPKALDQIISSRIQQAAGDIQEKVEKNVIPQLHALETQVSEQGRMLQEAFSVMGRTDTNLRRLVTQVDRLLEEVARRSPSAPPHMTSHIDVTSEATDSPRPRSRDRAGMFTALEDLDEFEDFEAPRLRWKFPLAIVGLLIAILTAVWYFGFRDEAPALPSISYKLSPLEQARAYETERNYPKAELAYRALLAKDPGNLELIRHLASILYREDKVEESDQIIKKLTNSSTPNP